MEGKVLEYTQAAQRFAQQQGIGIPGLGSNNGEARGGHGGLINGLDLKTAGKAAQQFAQQRGIQIPGLGSNNGEAQVGRSGFVNAHNIRAAGKAAQLFAQQRGIHIPGLGSNNGEAQEGHSGFDINAAGAAMAGTARSAAANVAKTFGVSSDSTDGASRGGASKSESGMNASGGDDPGAGESSELRNEAPQRPIPQRSHSFSGTSNFVAFGQHHSGGFYPAAGFASQPGTPHFPGQVAPGFHSHINNWGQPQGFFPPGFGQDFSGGIATQGHPTFTPQSQAWQPWGHHTQPLGLGFSNGFENPIVSNPGFMVGSSGLESARDTGDFWSAIGLAAGGGLAGTGLASAYNQGYVGSGGYGYDMMQPGPENPSAQNGELKTEGWGLPIPGKGGGDDGMENGSGGDKEKREGKKEEETKEASTTEQPPQGAGPDGKWLNLPTSYEVPDCTPKGLEILAMVDELTVQQEVEALEAAANAFGIGYEGNNLYKIRTRDGVQVFQAEEDTGFFWRCCCTQLRPVHIKVINQAGDQVGEMKKLALKDLNDIFKQIGTDADTFTITFPQDLKVETKATALAALLLVDLIFFEFGGGANRNLDDTWTFDCCAIFFCGCPLHCRLKMDRLFGKKNEDKGKGAPVADQIER